MSEQKPTHKGVTNIIGEPLESYVFKEIEHRQQWNYSGLESNRTNQQQQYLNNTNAWVKMASSVEIGIENINTPPSEALLGEGRLNSLGLNFEQHKGTKLAEELVLFNTTTTVNKPNSRSGISDNNNLWNSNSSYGLGGTEFGIVPSPGISDISIKCQNRGSIRKATINIKAFNKFQFSIIELLYLRIGYHIMLEWGNNKYYDISKKTQSPVGNTIIEDTWFSNNAYDQLGMIRLIEEYREKYSGNYDGFFGRVTNFNWKFNDDGSYDISIDLATVGDVVESLQVNLPKEIQTKYDLIKSGSTTDETTQLNEDIDNLIDSWLFAYSATKRTGDLNSSGSIKSNVEGDSDYFSFSEQLLYTNDQLEEIYESDDKIGSLDRYNRYVRLGELLERLDSIIVPNIKGDGSQEEGESLVELNYNDGQFMSINLNQTPLNPKVCIYKFNITDPNLKGIIIPKYLNSLKDFYFEYKGVKAGTLMNLYLNFDFVKTCLKQNVDTNGKLSLYRFLQNICNGINKSLGGVNKLEPIIKDDKIITIIDQNPIPGAIELLEEDFKENIIPLELVGYNKVTKQSNFVIDIDFTTSITPELASMVTIGATAGGSNIKGIDSTFFSKWNAGLQDRFNRSISLPPAKFVFISDLEKRQIKEDAGKEWDGITKIAKYAKLAGDASLVSLNFTSIYYFLTTGKTIYDADPVLCMQPGIPNGYYTKSEFVHLRYKKTIRDKITAKKLESDKFNSSSNYISYLVNAFGSRNPILIGNHKPVNPPPEPMFLQFNDSFIGNAQNSYREYLRTLTDAAYEKSLKEAKKTENIFQSNQIGFVPISLRITLQGISGIKIYNKLSIDQKFLPDNYPHSLHFIVKAVDHRVVDNNWVTTIDTISIPKTVPTTDIELISPSFKGIIDIYEGEEYLPYEERGPLPPRGYKGFSYTCRRSYSHPTTSYRGGGNPIDLETILKDFHPEVRNNFRGFFTEVEEKYRGYSISINSIGRSFEQSETLHQENPKNAAAGYSLHNYHMAVDFNLSSRHDPRDFKKKENKKNWVDVGIVDIAQKYNIAWGGNFRNYIDNVHFYYKIETDGVDINNLREQLDVLAGKQGSDNVLAVDPYDVTLTNFAQEIVS